MTPALHMVELGRGGVGDLVAVEAVMASAFDPRFGEAWTRGQCLGVMAMPGIALLLARVEGAVVGFALSRTILDETELLLLAVAPRGRRRGIGTRLLRSIIDDGVTNGVRTLHLEVRAENPAVALYRANGFRQTGRRPAYYHGSNGQSFDAHSYSLCLSD